MPVPTLTMKAAPAVRRDLPTALLQVADLLEPELAREFLSTILDVRSRINFSDLAEALIGGDITAAEVASQIDFLQSALNERLPEVVRRAFIRAAEIAADILDEEIRVGFAFNVVDPNAVRYTSEQVGNRITEVTKDTVDAVREIIKRSVGGEVGRVEPVVKEIQDAIGLRSDQMEAVRSYRDQLLNDGSDPVEAEVKATQYAHGLLKDRALLIARTEIMDALNAGAKASWRQAIDAGWIDQDQVKVEWIITPDDKLCPICEAIGAQDPVPWGQPFESPDGPIDRPPAHPQCRCTVALVPLTAAEIQAARDQSQEEPVAASGRVPVVKFNPYHEPAGSPIGGQFAEAPGGGGDAPDAPLIEAAFAKYGETDDIERAGFIFPDGRLLDMGRVGGGGITHYAVAGSLIAPNDPTNPGNLNRFMERTQAIRKAGIIGGMLWLEARTMPSEKQIKRLVLEARKRNGMELEFEGASHSAVYRNERPTVDHLTEWLNEAVLALAAAAKALKYSPDQPRVPSGHPDGGQWTDAGAGTGRHMYADSPRVFNTPDDVVRETSWGEAHWYWRDPQTGKGTGHLLTGEPLDRATLPEILYHTTTNAPAVMRTGVLLGQKLDAGLGGGQAPGVSFSRNLTDTRVIQRELVRAVRLLQGTDTFDDFEKYARADEAEAGLPSGSLNHAVDYARTFYDANRQNTSVYGSDEAIRGLAYEAFSSYLQIRGDFGKQYPLLKNPLLFGNRKSLVKLDENNIRILAIPSANIPATALVTSGSDDFLSEVRVYADVPVKRGTVMRGLAVKHYGPGDHPGTGTPQEVHGGGGGTATAESLGGESKLSGLTKLLADPDSGFTVSMRTGLSPEHGYVVSIYPDRSKAVAKGDVTLAALAEYVKANRDLLAQPGRHFGAWHDPKDGTVYLDVSVVVPTADEAETLARDHDQIAYFDLQTMKSVDVNRAATSGGQKPVPAGAASGKLARVRSDHGQAEDQGDLAADADAGGLGGVGHGTHGPVTHRGRDRRGAEAPGGRHGPVLKYSPDQPRVPSGHPDGGQWTTGGVTVSHTPRGPGYNDDDGTITLLHGTTAENAAAIRADGFKPPDFHSLANRIEDRYDLPRDSVWNHDAFSFERHFRGDDDKIYFTGIAETAGHYTVPESVSDALTAAYLVMHPEWDAREDREARPDLQAFIRRESAKLTKPEILAVTMPWQTVAATFPAWKGGTLADFKAAFDGDLPDNVPVPASKLRGVTVHPFLTVKHYGPGDHPGTGSPQEVHGGGAGRAEGDSLDFAVGVAEGVSGDIFDMRMPDAKRTLTKHGNRVDALVRARLGVGVEEVAKAYAPPLPGGLKTRMNITVPADNEIAVHVNVKIFDPDKRLLVGTIMRGITRDTVRHAAMELDKSLRGHGIGTKFSMASDALYRQMGVREVTLFAGSAPGDKLSGLQVWPLQGFTWAEGSSAAGVIQQDFIEGIDRLYGRTSREALRARGLKEAWEFATFRDEAGKPIGFDLMNADRLQNVVGHETMAGADMVRTLGPGPSNDQWLRWVEQEREKARASRAA